MNKQKLTTCQASTGAQILADVRRRKAAARIKVRLMVATQKARWRRSYLKMEVGY